MGSIRHVVQALDIEYKMGSATALPTSSFPPTHCCSMHPDELTLRVSSLLGFFVAFFLLFRRYIRRDPMVSALAVLFVLSLNNATRFQLDAISTVGFSDPILSYLSALQFNFDGARMLKDGYRKVIGLSLYAPFLVSNDDHR
jgi:hypothetical protein